MENQSGDGLLAELEQVREELATWRAAPGKQPKIPDSVWCGAVRVAKRHGLNPVCKALGLDYSCLKKRVDGPGRPRGRKPGVLPAFVEVKPETPLADLACVVEMEKGNGTKLRICCKAAVAVDWSKIKEAFLGA